MKNTILSLTSLGGVVLEDNKAIVDEILASYKDLIGSPFSQKMTAKLALEQALNKMVPLEFRDGLTAPVVEKVI